jgi:hypothetical protein
MVSKSGNQKGGGYGSRQHVEVPVRTGAGPRSARPAGVAQIGISWGNHQTALGGSDTKYSGERLHNDRTFQKTKFGNEVAANTQCGPGGSREVMRTGSQGQHGQVAGSPRPPGRGFDERG